MKVKSLSRVQLFATPWTVAYQASPSMGFSRQECWSGLPFPSPGALPHPGIEPGSPALQADTSLSEPPGKLKKTLSKTNFYGTAWDALLLIIMLYFWSFSYFPASSVGKESACNSGDPGSIPGSGRSAGEGIGYPLQYSNLENSMDCTVHGVTESQTGMSDFHFLLFQSRLSGSIKTIQNNNEMENMLL